MKHKNDSQMNAPFPFMQRDLQERYLNVLGVQRRIPDETALFELVQAHLCRIPFENISKLYYKKKQDLRSLPGLELFLDGIEQCNFGGTCYINNFYLYQLLANLGYQVKLCGADMANPDVHVVSMVTLGKREYLVDAGYAAPFLTPLPRDSVTDYVIVLGRDRYVLKPQDARGYSRLDLYRDGRLKHGYLAKPLSRHIRDFDQIIADSFRADATFMKALLLARFFPDWSSIVIHNLTVIESQGTESRIRMLTGRDELIQAIGDYFAIPDRFIRGVVRDLGPFEDAWG